MANPADTQTIKGKMNGHRLLITLVSALAGLAGLLLILLVTSLTSRVSAVENIQNENVRDGRAESPEQKRARIDSRVQHFWAETIKPELRAMEARLMHAMENQK